MTSLTCYSKPVSVVANSGQVPCGDAGDSVQLCCAKGDTCLIDSICHFTHPLDGASGYYIGGCTDQSYSDPVCSEHCTDFKTSDIVYNSTSELWACCRTPGSGLDCSNPGPETFQAAQLEDLTGISLKSISSISVLSSSASPVSNPVSSIVTSTSISSKPYPSTSMVAFSGPSVKNDPILGSNAKVGIIVGAVIAGLLIVVGVVLFRRRKRRNTVLDRLDRNVDQLAYIFTGDKAEIDSKVRAELDVRVRAELDRRAPAELDNDSHGDELH